jgi:hypothetical protein
MSGSDDGYGGRHTRIASYHFFALLLVDSDIVYPHGGTLGEMRSKLVSIVIVVMNQMTYPS